MVAWRSRRSRAAASRPDWLDPLLDEVFDLLEANGAVQDIGADTVTPSYVVAARIGNQRVEVDDPAVDRCLVTEEAFRQQVRLVTVHDRGDLVHRIFGVVLDPPERPAIMSDLGGLDGAGGIRRKNRRGGRQRLDLVAMDARTGEDRRLAVIERMGASGGRQCQI